MSEENTSPRSLPARYRSRRPLLILIGLFLAVGGAVATLPGVATWQITTQLERLGARSVAMKKVVINPATGEITVTGFKSVGPDGEDITVGRAHLQISLSALARRQITIQELSVDDADIDLRLDQRGRRSVGGFPMDFAGKEIPAQEPTDPWDLKANNIRVDNSRIALSLQGAIRVAMVKRLRLDALSTLRPEEPALMELNLDAGGGAAKMTGRIYPFADAPRATVKADIDGLDLETLAPLLKDGRIRKLSGKAAVSGEMSISLAAAGDMTVTYDGAARISGTRVETTLFQVSARQTGWKGHARIAFPASITASSALPDMVIKGTASLDGFSYRNTVTGIELAGKLATLALDAPGIKMSPAQPPRSGTEIAGAADFRLSDVNVKQPDTGLTLRPNSMRIVSEFGVHLPPSTAAFTARLSSTVTMTDFKGGMTSNNLDLMSADTFRLRYAGAKLGIGPKGDIETDGTIDLAANGVNINAGDTGSFAFGKIETSDQKFRFERSANGKINLSATGEMKLSGLRSAAADNSWTSAQKTIDWQGAVNATTTPGGNARWSTDGRLSNADIVLALPRSGLKLTVDESVWAGKASGSEKPEDLSATGEARIAGIEATLGGRKPYSARLKDIDIKGIAVTGTSQKFSTIRLSGFEAGAPPANGGMPWIKMPDLLVTGAFLDGHGRTQIDEVRVSRPIARFSRGPDGSIAMPSVAGKSVTASIPEENEAKIITPSTPQSSGSIRIGRATISEAKLEFDDASSEPPFSIETSRLQASLTGFDSAEPDSDAAFDVLLGLGKFGRVQIAGSMKPRFDNVTANAVISFKNIELFKFNGYIQPAIQHRIQQGRADGTVDLKIRNDKLDAKSKLSISRLKVKSTPSKKDGSGPPIETALGLLQDDKGNMQLSIPVTGSIDDPEFDLSDAIGQAIAGAMKETLLTAVKIAFPLGAVVAIVDAAGNPTIRIKPVPFPPGSAELSPDINARIAEAAAYLKKKPEDKPSICGPATAADLAILAKTDPKAGKADAIELATARINGISDQLVSKHSIPPKRLFVCAPDFSEKPDEMPIVRIDLKG